MRFDTTGKVSLDHIYTQPDPRAYFTVLRTLDYCVPQLAKPYFAKLLKEYREERRVAVPKVVDIGCSYGINAALLKYDVAMDELYARYGGDAAAGLTREGLLARDRELSRARRPAQSPRFIGLDTSENALDYAREAGFLDGTVHADLENHDPTPDQRALLSGADLVFSTGCIGYVTERTLTRVVRAQGGHRPWMAHFVLRMFPFDPVERALAGLGYETTRIDGMHKQRRFASPEEQALVLDTMAAAGVDATGLEAEGWLYAQLYVSRPYGPAGRLRSHDPHDPNREQL
ncbi:class I SAM-dependent methyltransferase [Streptomyces purpurogeneiscleroticus]|uniref:class I SAM-dependent methyltransferase n=1 Tax=Streptomyces purpurogeneiscleroticus TaxID=68259 RepID=UPI001CBAD71A|nr:class I SAM-dependent methyltransferase [Streptomyces purpurogeneiscleroticus]MBZ4014297.1 methyltransferase type 12 [Streptomyces purpurogeneiscleroticus]